MTDFLTRRTDAAMPLLEDAAALAMTAEASAVVVAKELKVILLGAQASRCRW